MDIQSIFPFLAQYKYGLFALAGLFEGFNTFVVGGFLVSINKFSFWPAFLTAFVVENMSGFMWYGIGYWGGSKPLDWLVRRKPKREKTFARIRAYLERYTGAVLFLTKITWSITIFTQIMAGSIRYNFKKFTLINMAGSFVWVCLTFFIGFFFGEGYQLYAVHIKEISYAIVFVGLALILSSVVVKASNIVFGRAIMFADRVREAGDKVQKGIDKMMSD